jgi:hypothetical protein
MKGNDETRRLFMRERSMMKGLKYKLDRVSGALHEIPALSFSCI